MRSTIYLLMACLLGASLPALATDGVIEINQAKALVGGVTASDTPGFPVTIDHEGSYRLTGNLDIRFLGGPATNITIIQITTRNVDLDLNGFTVFGPAICNGGGCTGASTGRGIEAIHATVHDGYVIGAGNFGVYIAEFGRAERIEARSNGGTGIRVDSGSVVASNSVGNGGDGIYVLTGIVRDSTASSNLGYGVRISSGNILATVASYNGLAGVRMYQGLLGQSLIDTNATTNPELECDSRCGLNANIFQGCTAGACFSGAGLRFQLPASSNVCDGAICP